VSYGRFIIIILFSGHFDVFSYRRICSANGSHHFTSSKSCYSVPVEVRTAEHCDEHVCLSVSLSVHSHISSTTSPSFTNLSVPVDCGSVFLWRHCDTLCSSGLVDDVMFHVMGLNGASPVGAVLAPALWR